MKNHSTMRTILVIFLFNSLITFSQKDSTLFRDKFYLEINGGLGTYKYSYLYNPKPTTNPAIYVEEKLLFLNFDLNFNFRNDYFKLGGTVFSAKTINGMVDGAFAVSLGANLVFFEPTNKYFGPYISYGTLISRMESTWFDYIGLGFEMYIRKFHLDFYYNKALNVSTKINNRMFVFNVGYAFNLASFRKKK